MLHYIYVYNERSFLTSGLEAEYQCKQSKSKKYLSALESLVWWANCLGNMATKIDSSAVSNLQRILHMMKKTAAYNLAIHHLSVIPNF